MEVRDASGAPTGRVEDVYVDRETTTIRYVALACDEPGNYRLVPIGVVRVERESVIVALEGEHLSAAPTVARDDAVTREHEGTIATYFRDLHDAGYMRPWAEPPQLHGAGYMRPGDEPPELHGAGYMRPGASRPRSTARATCAPSASRPRSTARATCAPRTSRPRSAARDEWTRGS